MFSVDSGIAVDHFRGFLLLVAAFVSNSFFYAFGALVAICALSHLLFCAFSLFPRCEFDRSPLKLDYEVFEIQLLKTKIYLVRFYCSERPTIRKYLILGHLPSLGATFSRLSWGNHYWWFGCPHRRWCLPATEGWGGIKATIASQSEDSGHSGFATGIR